MRVLAARGGSAARHATGGGVRTWRPGDVGAPRTHAAGKARANRNYAGAEAGGSTRHLKETAPKAEVVRQRKERKQLAKAYRGLYR